MRLKAMYSVYESGRSLEQVAEEFGYSVPDMLQEFRQRGFALLRGDTERFPVAPPAAKIAKVPGKRGRKPSHDTAQIQTMYERYENGRTLAEVAEDFKVSPATIGNLFRRAGLVIRPRGTRNWPIEVAQAMYARYEAGEPMSVIGESYDMTGTQVRQCFRHHGMELRTTPPKPAFADDESRIRGLWELFDGGMELEAVAAKANLTVGQLRALFQLHHLPLKRLTFTSPSATPIRKPVLPPVREGGGATPETAVRREPAVTRDGTPRVRERVAPEDIPVGRRVPGLRVLPQDEAPNPSRFESADRLRNPLPVTPAEEPEKPAGPLLEPPENQWERERLAMEMHRMYEGGKTINDIAGVYKTSAGLVQQLFGEFHLALKVEPEPRRPHSSRFKGPDRGW